MKYSLLILLGLLASISTTHAKEGYGISSWAGWKPGQISRAECPELRERAAYSEVGSVGAEAREIRIR